MREEVEWTLAMIKPDAVKNGKAQEIKQLIEIHGFTIIAQQKLQVWRGAGRCFRCECRWVSDGGPSTHTAVACARSSRGRGRRSSTGSTTASPSSPAWSSS